jgi:molybdopterin adenylyltransferase
MKVGRLTLSDRAAGGIYEDKSGPEIERVVRALFDEPLDFITVVLPDDAERISVVLRRFVDEEECMLVITTGGTGPSLRDVTPEATREVLDKELPGFGEVMRVRSYESVKTAILSRAVAGIRGRSLIINLPGSPRAIQECLELLGPAIAECLDHVAGIRPRLKQGVVI